MLYFVPTTVHNNAVTVMLKTLLHDGIFPSFSGVMRICFKNHYRVAYALHGYLQAKMAEELYKCDVYLVFDRKMNLAPKI